MRKCTGRGAKTWRPRFDLTCRVCTLSRSASTKGVKAARWCPMARRPSPKDSALGHSKQLSRLAASSWPGAAGRWGKAGVLGLLKALRGARVRWARGAVAISSRGSRAAHRFHAGQSTAVRPAQTPSGCLRRRAMRRCPLNGELRHSFNLAVRHDATVAVKQASCSLAQCTRKADDAMQRGDRTSGRDACAAEDRRQQRGPARGGQRGGRQQRHEQAELAAVQVRLPAQKRLLRAARTWGLAARAARQLTGIVIVQSGCAQLRCSARARGCSYAGLASWPSRTSRSAVARTGSAARSCAAAQSGGGRPRVASTWLRPVVRCDTADLAGARRYGTARDPGSGSTALDGLEAPYTPQRAEQMRVSFC
jgi:hypothetical protein